MSENGKYSKNADGSDCQGRGYYGTVIQLRSEAANLARFPRFYSPSRRVIASTSLC